jgi:hypothetical protein
MTFCKLCDKTVCCDFCKYFDYISADRKELQTIKKYGWCSFHSKETDPESSCENFYCCHLEERE